MCDYVASHRFANGKTSLKLAKRLDEIGTVRAELDSDAALTSVSMARSQAIGEGEGIALDLETAYRPNADLPLRLRAAASLACGLKLSTTVSTAGLEQPEADAEVSYARSLGKGRRVVASVRPVRGAAPPASLPAWLPLGAAEGAVEVSDKAFEEGATWVARTSLAPGEAPKLSLRRSWVW